MSRLFAIILLMCGLVGSPAMAANEDCGLYFKNKSQRCVDVLYSQIAQSKPDQLRAAGTFVGFFGELFSRSPEEKSRVLAKGGGQAEKSIMLFSLYRGGLTDEAKAFADANGLRAKFEQLRAAKIAVIAQTRPLADPGDNDLLISAYSVSGNADYLRRILQNVVNADEAMMRDGVRMGLFQGKFGPGAPPGRQAGAIIQSACAKYSCKTDVSKLMRLLTMSTAIWSLRSLSEQNEGIKSVVQAFMKQQPVFNRVLKAEEDGLKTYLLCLTLIAVDRPNLSEEQKDFLQKARRALDLFENLAPVRDVQGPLETLGRKI